MWNQIQQKIFFVNFEWILTPSSIVFIVNFELLFVYWTKSECYFFIQKLRLKFWLKWRID